MAKIINSQEFDNTIESGVVVVDFFATWCGPCQREIPHLQKLEEKYHGKDIYFVSISCDNNKKAWENRVRAGLKGIQLHLDQSMDLAQKFKIVSVPTLKVFKNGEEVDTLMGFMPKEVLKSKVEAHI